MGRLGDSAQAKEDTSLAVAADPIDALVNLHALTLPEDEPRLGAAHALIEDHTAPDAAVRVALATLQMARAQIVARIVPCGSHWRGFVSWPPGRRLRCTVASDAGRETYLVAPDPTHPLTSANHQVSSVTDRRRDRGPITLHFQCEGEPECGLIVTLPSLRDGEREPSPALSAEPRDLTVIVPVFEDEGATSRCLDSVEAQALPGARWRIVVVNDASPNAALVADIERRATEGRIELVTNEANLGFAATINRVVGAIETGDLLLLNADTVLPGGALARLMAIARTTPDLGTLTPLSNNGVVTSFPKPFTDNAMPPPAELAAWDEAARDADVPPIPIPNGIGFCLWVTRACWDAVGGLPLVYGRGYYEDVDFCLDAGRRGFRNLCAMNLIVAHAGSRSFKTTRHRLIRRNAARLDGRYPDYDSVIAAFRAATPFKRGFAAIEERIAPPAYDLIALNPLPVQSPSFVARLAQERSLGRRVLLIEREGTDVDERLRLQGLDGRLPQSLSFAFPTPEGRGDLNRYLLGTGAPRILIAAPDRCCPSLMAWAFSLKIPVEFLLAGPLPPIGLMRRASSLACADVMTFATARRDLPRRLHPRLQSPAVKAPPDEAYPPGRSPRLGILSPFPNAEGIRLTQAIALRLRKFDPPVPIIVIGTTLADLTLMADPSTIVTGPVPIDELGRLAERLSLTALVSPYRAEGFECLEAAGAVVSLPRAYFDRSAGHYPHRSGDLPLDPATDADGAAAQIATWLGALARAAP